MGINEKAGEVFSVAAENSPVAGCTVSKAVAEVAGGYVAHFSLAAGTDISAETYSASPPAARPETARHKKERGGRRIRRYR